MVIGIGEVIDSRSLFPEIINNLLPPNIKQLPNPNMRTELSKSVRESLSLLSLLEEVSIYRKDVYYKG